MKEVYRTGPVQNYFLGFVFIVVGIAVCVAPEFARLVPPTNYLIGGWAILLGCGACVVTRMARIEISGDGIIKFDGLGREAQRLAWEDATELVYLNPVSNRTGTRANAYQITGKGGGITLYDNFAGWDQARQSILNHFPSHREQGSNSSDAMLTNRPVVSSARQSRGRLIALGIFVLVWLAGFFSFAYFGQTSYMSWVDLYQAPDRWVVRYTFYNTSRFNALEFDVERTWLNSTEASVTGGVRVEHGRRGVIDVSFPLSANRPRMAAKLHSWWQYHQGSNGYTMSVMDKFLGPNDGAPPPIPPEDVGTPDN